MPTRYQMVDSLTKGAAGGHLRNAMTCGTGRLDENSVQTLFQRFGVSMMFADILTKDRGHVDLLRQSLGTCWYQSRLTSEMLENVDKLVNSSYIMDLMLQLLCWCYCFFDDAASFQTRLNATPYMLWSCYRVACGICLPFPCLVRLLHLVPIHSCSQI